MRYILYKILFGDPEGAEVFKKFSSLFTSSKEIDEDHKGHNNYWYFQQLGKLGEIDVSLIRWEVWSAWKDSDPFEPLVPGYIGSSCAIFFYFVDMPETWEIVKKQIERFWDRQQREAPISLVIALYDNEKITKKEIKEQDYVKEQLEFIKKKRADILFMPDKFAEEDVNRLFDGFCKYFMKKLDKEFISHFNLEKSLKDLDLYNLTQLLIAEKRGWNQKKLDRHLGVPEAEGPGEVWDIPSKTEEIATEVAESESTKIEEGHIISPEGEEIEYETVEEFTEEKLIEMDMKGYQLPQELKAIIPRYCPKCGNFNQRMIFERTDKNNILLDYPRIYGLKTCCGNCGCEWNQNTREILKYEHL